MVEWNEYVKLAIALMVVVDVPGNIPMFILQTQGMSTAEKRITALAAGVATAAVLFAFAFAGDYILSSFGITIEAFKILGGLVILLLALELLGLIGDKHGGLQSNADAHPITVGIFPMAVPLFAGPGAISTVMVYAHEEYHSNHDLILLALIGSVSLTIVVGLTAAAPLSRVIGPLTQRVLNRLLGIIVGALGIEFVLEGLAAFFPSLGQAA